MIEWRTKLCPKGANMTEEKLTFTFNNLIEASPQGESGIGNKVVATATPFCASNAVGTISSMSQQQVVNRAKAFAARFKAGMAEHIVS